MFSVFTGVNIGDDRDPNIAADLWGRFLIETDSVMFFCVNVRFPCVYAAPPLTALLSVKLLSVTVMLLSYANNAPPCIPAELSVRLLSIIVRLLFTSPDIAPP